MPLTLSYNNAANTPLEVEGVTPDALRELSIAEIEKMEVFHGNRKHPLAEFFAVSGEPESGELHWEGDLTGVHWIGAGMKDGVIRIAGNAGRHIGSEMSGGEIHVEGDVSDWLGAEMSGGLIHVRGRAGHLVGSAYRGSTRGMKGGAILVEGDCGNETGHTMRRGLIAIGGSSGDLAAFNMLAGTVILCGEAGIRHGAGMKRGTLVLLHPDPAPILPTFRYACQTQPLAMQLLNRNLTGMGFNHAASLAAPLKLYNGDMLEGGRGEILLPA